MGTALVLFACAGAAALAGTLEPVIGLRPEVAALLLEGSEGGAIEIAAVALPQGVTGLEWTTGLSVELAAGVLRGEDGAPAAAGLELYAYVLSEAGVVLGHAGWRAMLEPEDRAEGPDAGVRLVGAVTWTPEEVAGSATLRVLVIEPSSRRHGLASLPLATGGPDPGLPTPRFAASGEWRTFAAEESVAVAVSARPVRRAGETLAFVLESGPTERAVSAEVEGAELVLLQEGRERRRLPATRLRSEGSGRELVATLPEQLPAGRYRIRLESAAGVSPETELWVLARSPGGAGEPPAWTEVAWSVVGVERPGPAGRDPRPGSAPLARRQREILALLAERGPVGALDEQDDLIRDPGSGPGARRLLGVVGEVARELVSGRRQAEAAALLPWLDLHRLGSRRALRANDPALALVHREAAAALAAVLATAAPPPEARRLAADLLVLLAVPSDPAVSDPIRPVLEHARDLDPGHLAASRWLGFARERRGDLRGALEVLEPVVERERGDREARLHVASLRLRTGRVGPAEAAARALLGERRRDWVEAGAAALLTRSLLDRGRPHEALEVIRRASLAQPGEQRLQVLHAFVLDRLGRDDEALEVLEGLAVPDRGRASPERRYGEPAGAGLDDLRTRLDAALPSLRARLGRAVAHRWGSP